MSEYGGDKTRCCQPEVVQRDENPAKGMENVIGLWRECSQHYTLREHCVRIT